MRTLPLIALLAACGPQKSSSDDSSDTGAATQTSTGSATDTPTGGATDTSTATTDTPTTAEPISCEMYETPPAQTFHPVAITIRSELDAPVWIAASGCSGIPVPRILDAAQVDVFEQNSQCSPEVCQDFLGSNDCTLGCDDCGSAFARRVGPGSSFTMNWSGARSVPMQMVEECARGIDCQRECLRPEPLIAGTYDVELTAFRACTGACECDDLDPLASCTLFDSLETADPVTVHATLNMPGDGAIELVLD